MRLDTLCWGGETNLGHLHRRPACTSAMPTTYHVTLYLKQLPSYLCSAFRIIRLEGHIQRTYCDDIHPISLSKNGLKYWYGCYCK